MVFESLLMTHAEVAVAIAGFASVAAVLGRPLNALQRWRFLQILFTGFVQVAAGLIPVWLSSLGIVGPMLWRSVSVIGLLFTVILAVGLGSIFVRTPGLSRSAIMVLNWPATYLIYGLSVTVFVLLLVNAWGVPEPGFGLYYAALLAGMATVFLSFADVVVRDHEES